MSPPAPTRIPGHLRLGGWLPLHVHALLLEQYCAYEPFAATCLTLREAFDPWPAPATDPGLQDAQRQQIRDLAQRANLDRVPTVRANDYQVLHELIGRVRRGPRGEAVFGPGPAGSFAMHTPEFPCIIAGGVDYEWRGAAESLGQVATRIADGLGVRRPAELPDDVYRQILMLPVQAQRAGWLLSDARSALERQVRWLFRRLCPQDARGPWGYARIARAEGVIEPRIVQRPVRALADAMGIDLPDLPPGRPPQN